MLGPSSSSNASEPERLAREVSGTEVRHTKQRSLGEVAFAWAKNGARIFPVWWPIAGSDGGVRCACAGRSRGCDGTAGAGKHPIPAHGFTEATNDPATILEWWREYPNANIGFVPSSLGLVAADIDAPDHLEDARRFGLLSEPTFEVKTGSGVHLYFRWEEPIDRDVMLGSVILRGNHGYTLLPPSLHKNGQTYRAHTKLRDAKALPAAASEVLRHGASRAAARDRVDRLFSSGKIGQGGRHHALCTLTGHLAARGIDQRRAVELALSWNAYNCSPPKPEREVIRIVVDLYAADSRRRERTGAAGDVRAEMGRLRESLSGLRAVSPLE